jgi:hypothetical protein
MEHQNEEEEPGKKGQEQEHEKEIAWSSRTRGKPTSRRIQTCNWTAAHIRNGRHARAISSTWT